MLHVFQTLIVLEDLCCDFFPRNCPDFLSFNSDFHVLVFTCTCYIVHIPSRRIQNVILSVILGCPMDTLCKTTRLCLIFLSRKADFAFFREQAYVKHKLRLIHPPDEKLGRLNGSRLQKGVVLYKPCKRSRGEFSR